MSVLSGLASLRSNGIFTTSLFPALAAHESGVVLFTSRLEPPRNRQETAKRLESRVESARGPLSEPARAAKRLESARGPLFEPPRDLLPRDSSRLESSPDLGSSRLGSWHPRARRARAMLGSSLARVRLARAQHYQRAPCMTRSPISSPRPTYRHDGRPRSGQVAPS